MELEEPEVAIFEKFVRGFISVKIARLLFLNEPKNLLLTFDQRVCVDRRFDLAGLLSLPEDEYEIQAFLNFANCAFFPDKLCGVNTVISLQVEVDLVFHRIIFA